MNNIVLNPGQEKIKNEAVDWFRNSSSQLFEIDGLAGTGKSVLIGAILNELRLPYYQYMPMAYTGQASIVMRTKGFPTAKSIHSSLYEVVETYDRDDNLSSKFGVPAKKKEFRLRKIIDPNIRLFFIDEAYMVPKRMVKDILSFGIKTIVCGDEHQLPPVGDEPGFLTGYGIHHLTQLMRQSENNPIIYIANRAMKGLPIHCGLYGNDVLVINDDEFIPQMIGYSDCICCGTNRTREIMNNYVRSLAGFNGPLPFRGERVICRNNNWDININGIALANGLTGTVLNNPFGLSGETFPIDFLPDLTPNVFPGINVNYKYFSAPAEQKNALKNSYERKYMKGELFDFAYALTTHLCQGGEYSNVIYIEEFLKKQIQNQLNYTGITRAKQKLIYVKKKNKYFNLGNINN